MLRRTTNHLSNRLRFYSSLYKDIKSTTNTIRLAPATQLLDDASNAAVRDDYTLRYDEETGYPVHLLNELTARIEEYQEAKEQLQEGRVPTEDVKGMSREQLLALETPDAFLPVAQQLLHERYAAIEKLRDRAATMAAQRSTKEGADDDSSPTEANDKDAANALPETLDSVAELYCNDYVGNVFELPVKDLETKLPEGLPPMLLDLFERANGARLLLRQSTVDIIDELKQLEQSGFDRQALMEQSGISADGNIYSNAPGVLNPVMRDSLGNILRQPTGDVNAENAAALGFNTPMILLDGDPGVGKTTTLLQSVIWARSQGWITVCFNAQDLMNEDVVILENKRTPGVYDQNGYASSVLLPNLLATHGDQLAELPCQTQYAFDMLTATSSKVQDDDGEQEEEGNNVPDEEQDGPPTLRTLAERGLTKKQSSASVYAALIHELSAVVTVPVLFAIDNVNFMPRPSEYHKDMYGTPPIGITRIKQGKKVIRAEDVEFDNLPMNMIGTPIEEDEPILTKAKTPKETYGKYLRKSQLTIAGAVANLESQGIANGAVIGALASQWSRDNFLGTDELRAVREAALREIPSYSREEMDAVLNDYREREIVVADLSKTESDYVAMFSSRRAKEVYELATLL